MNPRRWEKVKRIFTAALKRPDSERSRFVVDACQGDQQLVADVQGLLQADAEEDSFLSTVAIHHGDLLSSQSGQDAIQLLPERTILSGRFQIRRLLGTGGMGNVYEAIDLELGMAVALKIIRPEFGSSQSALARFKKEVQLTRRIAHPSVCRIFDIGRHVHSLADPGTIQQDFTYLTMELLDGPTLSAVLREKGRFSTAEVLPIVEQIADALAATHSLGIVHRDIKPSNVVLVPNGAEMRVVITDFGLARLVSSEDSADGSPFSLTERGKAIGTFAYMAPEQLVGASITPQTDIYAFGLLLYEVLTGVRAWGPQSLSSVVERLKNPPAKPSTHLADLDPRWEQAILGCVQVDPAARFQSAEVVVDVIRGERFHSGTEIVRTLGAAPMMVLETVASDSEAHARTSGGLRDWKRLARIAVAVFAAVAFFVVGFRLYKWKANSGVEPGALIYLAPVNNDTDARALDNVTELIRAGLNQSGQVKLLDQETVGDILQQMAKAPDTRIDQPTGREIAMRAGAVRAIFPAVTGSAGNYELTVNIQQPDNTPSRSREHWSRSFAWHSVIPGRDGTVPTELLDAVRAAEGWIRLNVGESRNDIARLDVPPEDATTNRWAALDEYTQARKLILAGRRQDAVTALNRAVSLDPEFALAYAMRGDVLFSLHRENEGRDSYNKAIELGLQNRLTRREEDRIHGMRAADAGDYEIAVDVFHDLVLNYPQELAGWVYPTAPLRLLNRNDEAIANLRHAITLDPDASFAPYALGQELLIEGRTEEVPRWIEYLRQHRHPENADELESVELFLAHKYKEAREALASISTSANPIRQSYSYRDIAYLEAETGDDKDAIEELERGMVFDREHGDEEQFAAKLLGKAHIECRLGQYDSCLRDEHAGFSLSPTLEHAQAADEVLDVAIAACSGACLAKVREDLAELLRQEDSTDFGRRAEEVNLRTRGELQLAEGRPQDALRTMTTAAIKDTPAGNRDYLAHALVAAAKTTKDKAKARTLLLRAQAAYAALVRHPALVRCDPGSFPPGIYADQLEGYVRASQAIGDNSEAVRKAVEELRALRPKSALASTRAPAHS